MKTSSSIELYQKLYVEPQFERIGLFVLLQREYAPGAVLYPGCSIHITASFVFPHVVYVDRGPEAIQFFADTAAIQAYIDRKKTYKRSAYFRFIAQDYTLPLPLEEQSFDLLLALFAGVISSACKPYLKPGGLLVTNNSQGDAQQAAADPDFQLMAVVQYRKKSYTLDNNNPGDILEARAKTKRYLKQISYGVQYSEAEDYFIFQKIQQRQSNRVSCCRMEQYPRFRGQCERSHHDPGLEDADRRLR